MARRLLPVLILVLVCPWPGAAERPDWVSGTSSAYPKSAYLIGVGQGPSQEKAADKARAEIAKGLSLTVTAKTQATAQETSYGAESSFTQTVADDVRTSTAKVLDGVRIGQDAIIAAQVGIAGSARIGAEGEGFSILTRTLNASRPTIAAQAVGIAQGALDAARAYALERRQFGRPIAEFQGLQFMFADMATQIEAARALTARAAALWDEARPSPALSAMAKLFASDAAMRVTTDAVQVFGGYGFLKEFGVERFMRDAKITQIYEGTNQVMRLVVARQLLGRGRGERG